MQTELRAPENHVGVLRPARGGFSRSPMRGALLRPSRSYRISRTASSLPDGTVDRLIDTHSRRRS